MLKTLRSACESSKLTNNCSCIYNETNIFSNNEDAKFAAALKIYILRKVIKNSAEALSNMKEKIIKFENICFKVLNENASLRPSTNLQFKAR